LINGAISIESMQQSACRERNVDFIASPPDSKVGFAKATEGKLPINGLRHPPAADANGWYIWCGEEFSEDKEFFASLHTRHLYEYYPQIVRLLGLPPGFRFLSAGEYLDVWFDSSLLNI
jgi:hypothetical protein